MEMQGKDVEEVAFSRTGKEEVLVLAYAFHRAGSSHRELRFASTVR